jgi:hypothetical protein
METMERHALLQNDMFDVLQQIYDEIYFKEVVSPSLEAMD